MTKSFMPGPFEDGHHHDETVQAQYREYLVREQGALCGFAEAKADYATLETALGRPPCREEMTRLLQRRGEQLYDAYQSGLVEKSLVKGLLRAYGCFLSHHTSKGVDQPFPIPPQESAPSLLTPFELPARPTTFLIGQATIDMRDPVAFQCGLSEAQHDATLERQRNSRPDVDELLRRFSKVILNTQQPAESRVGYLCLYIDVLLHGCRPGKLNGEKEEQP